MPHWAQALAAVAGFLASWRWIIRPIRQVLRELLGLLAQIRDASGGVQKLAAEMREIAGAFVRYAISNEQRLDKHDKQLAEVLANVADIRDLLIDLEADVRRHERAHRREEGER